MKPAQLLRLLAQPRAVSALAFGFSGITFVAANLLLARALPVEQYALISLLVSVVSLGLVAAPLGLDGAVARKSVVMSSALLRRGLGCSALVAIIATIYVHLTYPITPTIAMLLIASICSGGVTGLVSTYFQTEHAYARALFYTRSQDFALFIAAIAAVVISSRVALMPFAVMALVFLVVGLYAWPDALRAAGSAATGGSISIREVGAYLSLQLSGGLLLQFERLLAANLLTPADLATLGVLLAVIGPPFRLLQMTAAFTLQPRLRSAQSHAERIRLLLREMAQAAAVVLVGSIALWFITPFVVRVLLHGKFIVSGPVLLAVLVSSSMKVWAGFAKASTTAILDNRELGHTAVIGWISIAVALLAAAGGSHWGLSGLVYGVALGWAVWVSAAAYFVVRRLRTTRA